MADPKYRQIAEDLRRRIELGELAPGTQLDTEADLMEAYGSVSRNTVRDAMHLLASQGLVEKRPGQGTFVAKKPAPFITTLSGHPTGGEGEAYNSAAARMDGEIKESEPRVEIHDASAAPELGLDGSEGIVSRHQLRRLGGKPYSMQTSFYPRSFVAKGAEHLDKAGQIEGGTIGYVAQTVGIRQGGWREKVTVRIARGDEIAFFNLPANISVQVFETRRIGFSEDGKPIRLTVTVYPVDANILVYEEGDVPPDTGPQ